MLLDVFHLLRIFNLCNDLEIISACIYMLYGLNCSSSRCEEKLMEVIIPSVVWCGVVWCGVLMKMLKRRSLLTSNYHRQHRKFRIQSILASLVKKSLSTAITEFISN